MLKPYLKAFLLACWLTTSCWGQKPNEKYQYHIRPVTSTPKIDGLPDDEAWLTTEVASDFFMIQPMDTSYAPARTYV